MRMLILFFGLLLSSLPFHAQQAPDFTVTDINGQVHHLYADYLNQGKTVMIKIFFTTCPPCNSIAPYMEPLYQEWGGGNNDVEFFEMSDKTFDTNALVAAYSATYNETFPAISNQGGSVTTVQPYKNGSFGPWYGTPTFLVIAPDGSVQFNIDGNSNQATIDSIDVALTNTGAEKPGQTPIAPDFTVTDTYGQVHHLYADYLNLGKSVMLEVFNTTCSPCNSIASLLEPLYQEWGGGNNDVEFLILSDKTTDTNPLVVTHQTTYSQTFPGISKDGGSVPAVLPYKNGTFGPWIENPTFVVIAPDGTVQYDVDGANNPATIDAIDAALTATGAEKPVPIPIAPDFTVTDTDGQVHHLYADYLNQGKTVMIEVFNTTCSPCNSIAPLLQPLYEDWGGGDSDVEFFIMSDKNSDTNPLVFAHQETYNQTFRGISKDGGSVAAVLPYKDGTFGPWIETPTFVVISPDGTVQYNVDGANNQATIDAVNAAITATGATPPIPPTVAPDFTVTDTDGQIHHLYADYLNQGKTVLLEVFYTTCPPCNSIAPLMEPLYQAWGAGDYDVEFFAMSDKNSDTNPLVTAFHTTYNETFLGISKDGGSLAAVQPYKNGSFGPWTGTPTYIVIAPDGSVTYDVDGPNNQANIDAIDAALAATGAQKPVIETPVSVTGLVQFLQGSAGVDNALVQVVNAGGTVIFEDSTDANGGFNFEVLLSAVQPDWVVKVVKNGNPANGVSALDLVRIQKHLLFIDSLDNPLSKIAADANRSGTISSLDIVTLLKLLLGITNNFPDQQTWIVIPADTNFGPPTQHPPVITSYTIPLQDILNGVRAAAFIAIKKGDVNGNANPNG